MVTLRTSFSGTIPAILGAVVAFKAASAAIVGAQGLIGAIKLLKQVMAGGAISASFNPVVLIAGAIAAAAFLIIKNWEPISGFFKNLWSGIVQYFENSWARIKAIWQKITGAARAVKNFFGMDEAQGGSSITGGNVQGVVSANRGVQESRTESRSVVDLNVNNLPQGSSVRQRGQSPDFTLNTSYGLAAP